MDQILYPILDLKQTISSNRLVGLWRLMNGFRLIYLGAVIALSVATLAQTSTNLLLKYFVDDILFQEQPAVPFYIVGLGFVGLAIFQGAFTYLSGKLAARSAQGIILRLRNYLFDHIQRLPFSYHDHTQTGDLVQRCSSDVDTIQRFFADQAIGVGRILLLFFINFVALFSLNTKLALFSLITTPIVLLISVFFFKKIHTAYEAHQEQEGELSTALQENLSGVRVVKAFARQSYEMDKFEKANQKQYELGRKLVFMHGSYWPIVETISGIQMLLIFFLGGMMVINGEITIGTYLAVAGLIIWIVWPMQNLGRLMVQTSMGLVSYTRVAEIITELQEKLNDVPLEQSDTPSQKVNQVTNGHKAPNGLHKNDKITGKNGYSLQSHFQEGGEPLLQGAVEFHQVSFKYDEHTPILQDITFKVEPGQTIALTGPTGSGKSSLISLLPRFYDRSEGMILLDSLPIESYPLHALRKHIGIVEQESFLFSRTIRDNIAYGVDREVSDLEIEYVAQAAAIHEVIMAFPKGYDTLVGEKGVTLSGGQKQRICIARTLLKNPPILIFDDAVSAVDTETEGLIHAALEQLRQNRTTFIIAHRMQTLMRADQILVLEQGKIVEQGSHLTLMAQDGIYRQTYQLQAQIEQASI